MGETPGDKESREGPRCQGIRPTGRWDAGPATNTYNGSMNPSPFARRALCRTAAVCGLVLAVGAVGTAQAKDPAVGPLQRFLEGLDVSPAIEHRIVIVHPIAAVPRAPKPGESLRIGGTTGPDVLAFGRLAPAGRPRFEAMSFAQEPIAFFPGDVLRSSTEDVAITRTFVLTTMKPLPVPLIRLSREVPAENGAAEPEMLGPVLPSPLRYALLADQQPTQLEILEEGARWALDARLESDRRSPAELFAGEKIRKRVSDYRASLSGLFKLPPPAGREFVGCAVLVGGLLAEIETFPDGRSFASAWPRLIDGIAVEAAVQEAKEGILDQDLSDSADPDRLLPSVKDRILKVFGARTEEQDVKELGREVRIALDGANALAFLHGENVVHFVLVTDPAHRADKKTGEDPDPGPASRKARPTEEEKRVLDRRNGGAATPVPAEPAPAPAPR